MKDNFSSHSDQYAKYRPTYPPALYRYLYGHVADKQCAWDCGTGNGQVARELAKVFDRVFATDISQAQLDNALQAPHIHYSVQPAERTNFKAGLFDLVVVAQAIHWFDFERFYGEVRRTAKAGALIAVIGYGRITVSEPIDRLLTDFYGQTLGNYWDEERRYIDEGYQTIPFPFDEIEAPAFESRHEWTLEHLIGYLNTWSAVKHFIRQRGYNPVDSLQREIERHWHDGQPKTVCFPLLLRVGRIVPNASQAGFPIE